MGDIRKVIQVSGWPDPEMRRAGGAAVHSITLSIGTSSATKRGRHRNKGDTGRWSESQRRALFVSVVLLRLDKKYLGVGRALDVWPPSTADALRYLAAAELPYFQWNAPKARETRDPQGWRVLHKPRSDAKADIVLGGLAKGRLPKSRQFRDIWIRARKLHRQGKARIVYEKPPTFSKLHDAYFRHLREEVVTATDAALAMIAASLAAQWANVHAQDSGESYFDKAHEAILRVVEEFRHYHRRRGRSR